MHAEIILESLSFSKPENFKSGGLGEGTPNKVNYDCKVDNILSFLDEQRQDIIHEIHKWFGDRVILFLFF